MKRPKKPWRFFLHYNKPMSRKAEVPVWTIHWKGKCYQAYKLTVRAWTETHEQNRQPRGIVRGYAWQLELVGPQPEGCNLYAHAYVHAPTSHGGEIKQILGKHHHTITSKKGG